MIGIYQYNPKALRGPALQRFLRQIDKTETCWNWLGFRDKKGGYARFRNDDGKWVAIHRWSYEHFVGPIPEGHDINHRCFNTGCANPGHLEPATNRDNLVLMGRTNASFVNHNKTHCSQGHEFTDENTRIEKVKTRTIRRCRQCHRIKVNKWRHKHDKNG